MAFAKDGYELVKGVIKGDLLEYLNHIIDLHEYIETITLPPSNAKYPHSDDQIHSCFAWYGSYHSEALLIFLKSKIEQVTNLSLLPTYSYYRTYYNGSYLSPHRDRESCQYSATLCIEKDKNPWPIYFQHPSKGIVSLDLEAGDMAVYTGMDLTHWRNPFYGQKQKQMFLHYVDANGPYAENFVYDSRPFLGLHSKGEVHGQVKSPEQHFLPQSTSE